MAGSQRHQKARVATKHGRAKGRPKQQRLTGQSWLKRQVPKEVHTDDSESEDESIPGNSRDPEHLSDDSEDDSNGSDNKDKEAIQDEMLQPIAHTPRRHSPKAGNCEQVQRPTQAGRQQTWTETGSPPAGMARSKADGNTRTLLHNAG